MKLQIASRPRPERWFEHPIVRSGASSAIGQPLKPKEFEAAWANLRAEGKPLP